MGRANKGCVCLGPKSIDGIGYQMGGLFFFFFFGSYNHFPRWAIKAPPPTYIRSLVCWDTTQIPMDNLSM